MIFLPDAEIAWTKQKCDALTDKTDGQNHCGYYSGVHCEHCEHTIKMKLNCIAVEHKTMHFSSQHYRPGSNLLTFVNIYATN